MSNTSNSEPFFKFYKFLLDEKYNTLSFISKGLYSFICDRMQLSIKNGWKDNNGNYYVYLTKFEAAKIVGKSPKTIHKHFKELVNHNLILDKRMGLNKPNRLYITRMCKNYISRYEKDTHLGITNLLTSNTDTSETELSYTEITFTDLESDAPIKNKKALDLCYEYLGIFLKVYESTRGKKHRAIKRVRVLLDVIECYNPKEMELAAENFITRHLEMFQESKITAEYFFSSYCNRWNEVGCDF